MFIFATFNKKPKLLTSIISSLSSVKFEIKKLGHGPDSFRHASACFRREEKGIFTFLGRV
jgi:hypothetical protein